MKKLIIFLILFSATAMAQQLTFRLPRDAGNTPLSFGVGNPYAFELAPTSDAYSTDVRYEIPSSGADTNRAYRHLYVLNRSGVRTVYVCFGNADGCSTDSFIVRPEYGLVFEPLRFGAAVGLGYIYVRLDEDGAANVDLSVW